MSRHWVQGQAGGWRSRVASHLGHRTARCSLRGSSSSCSARPKRPVGSEYQDCEGRCPTERVRRFSAHLRVLHGATSFGWCCQRYPPTVPSPPDPGLRHPPWMTMHLPPASSVRCDLTHRCGHTHFTLTHHNTKHNPYHIVSRLHAGHSQCARCSALRWVSPGPRSFPDPAVSISVLVVVSPPFSYQRYHSPKLYQ